MKTRTFLQLFIITLIAASVSFAAAPKKYGKKISMKEKTKISDIMASPEKYHGKRVLVEGEVADVCQEQGCWITLKSEDYPDPVRFKVKDGVIVFPKDAKGKTAVAQGIVDVKMQTKEEQIAAGQHFAMESGKVFDPATVIGPKAVVTIKGEGAVLK